jgi:Zn-dependent protease with chaperone function
VRSRVRPQVVRDLRDRRAGAEDLGDARRAQGLDVVVRDDPADRDQDVAHAAFGEQLHDPRHQRHVGTRQDGQADHVDVLLERCRGDHLGRLAEAGVDDLEPFVAQAAGEDLGAAIVAVEAGLGDEHLERAIGHGADRSARRSIDTVRVAGSPDRETFDRAQRRHRRNARLRAIPATLAAAAMGIPLGVYLSPVLLALSIVVTDLVNFVVPAPDLGGAVWDLLDRLINGDPGTVQAVAWILVIWLVPGIVLLLVAYPWIAWRLRRIGGEGIALGIGARPPRDDDAQERQLVDVVNELAIAAGIDLPAVLLYDDGPSNAFVYGRDHDHATVVVGRRLLDELDREETQGVVARLVASAVDGDLGLAIDIGAVYVTYGLLVTTLSAFVSHEARVRWRGAIGPLVGRRRSPREDGAGVAALLGMSADDDTPDTTASGCLTLITMGGIISVGVALLNLFLTGPLLTFAWRSRGYLADATAVDLTRDPEGLARGLTKLDQGGRSVPGTAWLELLLVVGGSGGATTATVQVPSLSDSGLAISLAPPVSKRLARLRAMGGFALGPATGSGFAPHRPDARVRRHLPLLAIVIIAPLLALLGILVVIATALIVYLAAIAAFIILAVVAGPIHDLLRGLAGH